MRPRIKDESSLSTIWFFPNIQMFGVIEAKLKVINALFTLLAKCYPYLSSSLMTDWVTITFFSVFLNFFLTLVSLFGWPFTNWSNLIESVDFQVGREFDKSYGYSGFKHTCPRGTLSYFPFSNKSVYRSILLNGKAHKIGSGVGCKSNGDKCYHLALMSIHLFFFPGPPLFWFCFPVFLFSISHLFFFF